MENTTGIIITAMYACPSECLEGVASYTVGRIMDLSVADQLLLMNQKVPGLKIQ